MIILEFEKQMRQNRATTQTTIVSNSGNYSVEVTENGCSSQDTLVLSSIALPDVDLGPDITIECNETIILSAGSYQNYVWQDGSSVGSFEVSAAGTYELTVTDANGCSNLDVINILVDCDPVYWVPNTFTPDDDSFNQYFLPVFTSGYDPFDYDLFIFNRWGQIIWESHDSTVGWDGTYGGKSVENGTYVWKIEFKTTDTDERMMATGHVNVFR